MVTKTLTVVYLGIKAKIVEIQTHIANGGLPCFNIVGLANKSVNESKERIRAAFSTLNINLSPKHININLSPSDLKKEGCHFDLPIALSILLSLGIIPSNSLDNFIILGKISLNGDILATKGTLSALVTAVNNKKNLIFPKPQIHEVSLFANRLNLIPCSNIKEIIQYLNNKLEIKLSRIVLDKQPYIHNEYLDLKDIKGQESAKKALEIAAAGGHNMLMIGPTGVGKSTLANSIKGILPPLNKKEMLEVSIIYSIAGKLGNNHLITNRPFRSPHYSISLADLIGSGEKVLPGEITLASKGILFLDKLAEFNRNSLDSLKEPLESKQINIYHANGKISMPCDFQLIAATNPCYCGYFSIPDKECTTAPKCAINYQNKLSGPLLDRIDLIVELSETEGYNIINNNKSATSNEILQKVIQAREIQYNRYKNKSFKLNANIDNKTLISIINNVKLNRNAWKILNLFANKFKISLRSYNKIIKLSRTISDLKNKNNIDEYDISEAISYRKTDCLNGYIK